MLASGKSLRATDIALAVMVARNAADNVRLALCWLHEDFGRSTRRPHSRRIRDSHLRRHLGAQKHKCCASASFSTARKHSASGIHDAMSWPQDMAKAGANMYTFHLECPCFEQPSEPRRTEAVAKLAAAVREAGMHAGVALRPSTPVEAVMPYLEAGDFDLVREHMHQSVAGEPAWLSVGCTLQHCRWLGQPAAPKLQTAGVTQYY